MQYFFLLGKNYNLSAAEVYTVLQSLKVRYSTTLEQDPILLIETDNNLDLPKIQQILGGTIKTGKILGNINKQNNEKLANFLNKTLKTYSQQLHFGINIFTDNKQEKSKLHEYWTNWGLKWKQTHKTDYQRLRFVISKNETLSSVIIKKNKLILEHGCDLNLIFNQDQVFIGQSVTVQDFKLYSQLDYGRPAYDAKVGMLPPKLAQILINLSRLPNEENKDLRLLDPFCGSGTVLNQAIYSGFIHIYGSDIDPDAIRRSIENLAYIKKKLKAVDIKENILACDINKLSTVFTKANINKVITEIHLGPALQGRESKDQLNNNKRQLEKLYRVAFQEIYKTLQPGGILVITIPIFLYKQQLIKFDIQNLIYDNFKKAKILDKHKNLYTKRKSLIYKRPNQKLWREIFVFQKQQIA